MKQENTYKEIAQCNSFQANSNKPMTLSQVSEKEKIIQPKIDFKNEKPKNEENKKNDKNQEISNNRNENRKESNSKKVEEQKIKKEEKKDENPKGEEIKLEQKEEKKIIENIVPMKNNNIKKEKQKPEILKPKKEEQKNVEVKVEEVGKEVDKSNVLKENRDNPSQTKEVKDTNKISDISNMNHLPKTLITQKTENNYDLMMKYFKKDNYKRGDDCIIESIINYDDFSNDKFLGLVSEKKEINNKNVSLIYDFLERNKNDIEQRQNNNRTVNDRIKLIDESTKKKLYFNNKKSQQDFFDSFYKKQIEYKNNCKEHLDKLTKKYEEEILKTCIPETKKKSKLDYFQNNEPIKLSRYCIKIKNSNNINNEENFIIKENQNENNYINDNKIPANLIIKKNASFGPNKTISVSSNNPPDNNNVNDSNNKISNNNNTIKKNKFKKVKSESSLVKINNNNKLKKKEIEDLTNKLHYNGELKKIKKQIQISEEIANNANYHNFSKEKLTRPSIIILIKKLLYEYSMSVKKNTYSEYTKNPKLNYDQYIDILKDLYYLDSDALPEEYLEDDTMYKELWNKLIQFSVGPENSIESNVFLLYLLELNGYFSNENIIKELEKEIYWIKLQDYDDLIANSKYIEENWDDLKMAKNNNIKKLKLEGRYNPIHCKELYNNYNIINTKNNPNIIYKDINKNSNHYITTLKGNTNYHLIHGYNTKNKNNEENLLLNSINKKEENKYNSSNISNISNKNRTLLRDSYKDLIEKKKIDIENIKKIDEQKIKEICTFKPQINTLNNKLFTNKVKIELPKHKKIKSNNINSNNTISQDNNNLNNLSNQNTFAKTIQNENDNIINERNLTKTNNNNYLSIKDIKSNNNQSQSPNLKGAKKNKNNNIGMKRNKSSLQKMFNDNPLKNNRAFNDRTQKLKIVRNNGKEYDNYYSPMRFDIEHHNKYEDIGVYINRDNNMKQRTQNIIFYNIKVNDKIKTLKYIEGDNLKLNVINFVHKNKLPEEVTDIILTKIKEKTNEENF